MGHQLNYRGSDPKKNAPQAISFDNPQKNKDLWIPIALIMLGLVLIGLYAFFTAGANTAAIFMGAMVIIAAVETVLGILAAYITASILKTGFGELWPACLKLCSIIVFTTGIYVLPGGWIWSLIGYFALLRWFFELETYEVIVFAIVFFLVRVGVVAALSGMLAR